MSISMPMFEFDLYRVENVVGKGESTVYKQCFFLKSLFEGVLKPVFVCVHFINTLFGKHISMGESNTVVSAYRLYRHLQ